MTPEEKDSFIKELTEKFILVPKDKLYRIVGGAIAVIVAATGFSLASVFAYLRSEPAEIARKRIDQIRGEAETKLKELQVADNYIHYGSKFALEWQKHPGFHLQGFTDKHVGVEKNPLSSPFVQWTILQVPQK